MQIERVPLPGIGYSHTFTTRDGHQVGVVSHRTGHRGLAIYSAREPHEVRSTAALTPEEAHHLADLLHATVTVDHVATADGAPPVVDVARVRIAAGSPVAGRPLADLPPHARDTVVAVIRDDQVVTGPEPEFVLLHDDTVVAVGGTAGVAALTGALAANDP